MATMVEEIQAAEETIFATRVKRLEEVSRVLRGLYTAYATCQVAEIEAKADAYNNSHAPSHGERQGIASASTAELASERLTLKGQIDALEEERDHLRFLIEWVGE